jgi:hypothetical protein
VTKTVFPESPNKESGVMIFPRVVLEQL